MVITLTQQDIETAVENYLLLSGRVRTCTGLPPNMRTDLPWRVSVEPSTIAFDEARAIYDKDKDVFFSLVKDGKYVGQGAIYLTRHEEPVLRWNVGLAAGAAPTFAEAWAEVCKRGNVRVGSAK